MQVAGSLVEELLRCAAQRLIRKLGTFVMELAVPASCCPTKHAPRDLCLSGSVLQPRGSPVTLTTQNVSGMRGPHLPSREPHSAPGTGLGPRGLGRGPPRKPGARHAEHTQPHPPTLGNSLEDFTRLVCPDRGQPLLEARARIWLRPGLSAGGSRRCRW